MQATSLRRADRQWRWPLGRDLCLRLLAIAILSGATLMFHASTARFDVAEADIVENLDWSRHGAGWSASRFGARLNETAPATVTLWRDREQPRLAYVLRLLPILPDVDHLLVDVKVRVAGVPDRRDAWEQASVHVEHFDERYRRLGYWPYRLAALSGDLEWQRIRMVMPVDREAAVLRFVAFQGGPVGTMELTGLSIRAARETQVSMALGWALRIAWPVLLLGCVLPLLRRREQTRWRLATLLLGGLICLGSLIPQPQLGYWITDARNTALILGYQARELLREGVFGAPEQGPDGPRAVGGERADKPPAEPEAADRRPPPSDETAQAQKSDGKGQSGSRPERQPSRDEAESDAAPVIGPPPIPWYRHPAFASLGAHFVGYLSLAFIAVLAYRRWPAAAVLASVAALAVTTECLQSFMVTRDSELSDLLANLGGVALGGVLALLCTSLYGRRALLPGWPGRTS